MSRKKRNNIPIFGKKLTFLRKGHHLTQTELAEQLGLTKEMINYLENRAKNPTMEQIKRFADFFHVPADELIYDSDAKHKPGPQSTIERQIEELKKLPKSKQQTVSEMIAGVLK